ncbi:MAG: molybdopterin-binding protein, partial [Terriglobales bacterium]
NGPALAALARRAGAAPALQACVPDSLAALNAALDRALAEVELVIFSGGSSVGAYDLVAPVLAARGAEFFFDAVRMRPGRPVLFARVAGRLCFGLPGNPLGAMLSFAMCARPAIELLAGVALEAVPPACVTARLGFDYRGPRLNLTAFHPARLRARGLDTEVEAIPYHSSADLAAAAAANGFWLVPEGVTELAAGSAVQVLLK